jgi:hypothetical protein
LAILQEQQGSSWRDLVTLDESWFSLDTDHERIWLVPGKTPPDRENHMIQWPKFMLTIVWGLLGCMPSSFCPGGSFNASYDMTEILSEVVCWCNGEPGTAGQQLIVHSDNARTQGEADSELY